MTPTIRPAHSGDIAAIARIYGHAVQYGTASFELDPPDEAEMARRMAALHDSGFPYLAAEVDGRVAGYAYAGLFRTRPAYRFTIEDSIYIAPDMQGRGIGRALLGRLLAESAARGFRQMIAVIADPPRQQASIRLHTAAGFARIGTLSNVGYKFGAWLDNIYMQRALGDGAGGEAPLTTANAARSEKMLTTTNTAGTIKSENI
ncbi:MAG: GNAT family N-acetyltransferase [Candidatus Accumulibacter sp.]|jgi:phosphinothricin acetyltransferase|nr:GNAT family N-acetyltransferase [Accumulibacter sp.]